MHPNQPIAHGCIMLFYMQFIVFATALGFFVYGLSFADYTETFRFLLWDYMECFHILNMSKHMEFRYFINPKDFAFLMDQPKPCSICKKVSVWFDTGGYPGVNEIECICVD